MRKQFFNHEPRVFAHRGVSGEYPENTMTSFKKAVEIGADVIETDVHFTRDGRFAVIHDDTLNRLTDGTGKICDYTMDELKRFDAGFRFTPDGETHPFRGTGLTIPSLDELLSEFPEQRFNIDLKDKNPAQAGPYCELITRHNAAHRVLTASEHRANLAAVRTLLPEMATSASMWEAVWIFFLYKTGFLAQKSSYAFDAFQVPEYLGTSRVVTPHLVRMLRDAGVRVHVWTINREEDMRRLISCGIDAIMSDNPALVKQVFESLSD